MNKILLPLLILLWALFGSWWWNCNQKPTVNKTSVTALANGDSLRTVCSCSGCVSDTIRGVGMATTPVTVVETDSVQKEVNLSDSLEVYFTEGGDTYIHTPRVKQFLDTAKVYLKSNPNEKLLVTGYTNNNGSADFNQKLSERRAKDLKAVLVKEGFKAEHLETRGAGMLNPKYSNDTPEGKAKNRRAEIVLKGVVKKIEVITKEVKVVK